MNFSTLTSTFRIKISSLCRRVWQHWQDIAIIIILAAIAGFLSYQGTQLIGSVIVEQYMTDTWFGADCPRVFKDMAFRGAYHGRTKVHPLFVLITLPPVYLITKVLGIQEITVVMLTIAMMAAIWISMLFILLRLMGCHRFDATLFSILGASSASAVFWFVVPETYPFGSLTILLALVLVAVSHYQKLSPLWYVLVSSLTLSMTITNWMVGILATIVNHPWKRALQITVNAFCLVVVLWAVQKYIFPSVEFFLGDREEEKYIVIGESNGLLGVIKSFVSHTLVMPAIQVIPRERGWPLMSTQHSLPGSGSLWGAVAVGLWLALLSLGLWGLFSVKKHPKFRIVLGFTLLGQLALHSVYGHETFLYSLHFAPLLVLLAALSTLTRVRWLGLVLAGTLIVTAGINNGLQLGQTIEFFQTHDSRVHPNFAKIAECDRQRLIIKNDKLLCI